MHSTISDFRRWVGIWDSYLFPPLLFFLGVFLILSHNVASAALLRNAFLGLLHPNKKICEILGSKLDFPSLWCDLKVKVLLRNNKIRSTFIFLYIHIIWFLCSKRKVVKVKGLFDLSCNILCGVFYSPGTAVMVGTWSSWTGDGEYFMKSGGGTDTSQIVQGV